MVVKWEGGIKGMGKKEKGIKMYKLPDIKTVTKM